ncbi:hypothetical protein ONS95_008473 [Cadophora gregata]|uniref:uncharacterized protein n=1 Tax=Cadophora gregata TaxID=51156 RepID=UPI0026DD34C6|nr:uncharacterized protein ONS95_008473 [Cadophora gregata]KAK0100134.1 hypothetical protein ONS95_008473 [Cadophora gregata]
MRHLSVLALVALPFLSSAQLTTTVGPTTSLASKSKVCNVLSYGAKADGQTDIGPAILSAFNNCAKDGGATIYIPPGGYVQNTWITLNGGSSYALQIDGVITRTGTAGGHMIIFSGATDLEVFSKTSRGAIQGAGYKMHNGKKGLYGPRIFRFTRCTSFSVHDLALIDAPAFTLIVEKGSRGELYNLVIRAGDEGGLDGIDIWGDNIWAHDIEVTNRDECVTVKSPASNCLIERVWCNQSGGSAMGSLGEGTAISNIVYRNIYTWASNQAFMIKSQTGGSGYVRDCLFENFIVHGTAYTLNIDQYWSGLEPGSASTGVQLTGLTFRNWSGTAADGNQRSPIQILCSDAAPCTDINLEDMSLWTDAGSSVTYKCRSAHGTGACLKSGTGAYAAVSQTVNSPPAGYRAPKMSGDLGSGFGLSSEIPIPRLPTSYFPGLGLIKPLMSN